MIEIPLKDIPESPGVYLFLGDAGRILYVGKAKNLKSRLSSYAGKSGKPDKTMRMLSAAKDVRFIVTSNEIEAFLLELNLIKTEQPKYNVMLKDAKGYPYIKLTREEFPRLMVSRQTNDENADYFGPFVDAGNLRELVNELLVSFPLRSCTAHRFRQGKICLKYQIKRCLGPCEGKISKQEYDRMVDEVRRFFRGEVGSISDLLETRMKRAAENLDFEQAARLRDRLNGIDRLFTRQTVLMEGNDKSIDVFVGHDFNNIPGITQMFVRGGRLLGSTTTFFPDEPLDGLVEAFITQFYNAMRQFPDEVATNMSSGLDELEAGISALAGKTVHVRRRGLKGLIDLGLSNGNIQTELYVKRAAGAADRFIRLADVLHLDETPRRIECIDISHLAGNFTVGVSVVSDGDEFSKKDYRKYRIRDAANDDFTSIHELMRRKAENVLEGSEKPCDLYVIDGGVGQLNAAVRALSEIGLDTPAIGISKGRSQRDAKHAGDDSIEELHIHGRKNPVRLKRSDPALLFVQKIRDEAHRFAITYSRNLALKRLTESPLLEIEGVGKKRYTEIISAMPDIHTRKDLTVEEVVEKTGIPASVAEKVVAAIQDG